MYLSKPSSAQQCTAAVDNLLCMKNAIVSRLKEEGSLVSYTNEVTVEIDYTDVDPDLLSESDKSLDTQDFATD